MYCYVIKSKSVIVPDNAIDIANKASQSPIDIVAMFDGDTVGTEFQMYEFRELKAETLEAFLQLKLNDEIYIFQTSDEINAWRDRFGSLNNLGV